VVPWHALPHYHRTSVHRPVYDEQTLAVSTLLRLFHRDRLKRVMATTYGKKPADSLNEFSGAIAVSFLTTI
jgi:fatty acid desaturase